ncbi:hypothetical protein LTR40_014289, partial [Exophiala xenobiotica]
MGDLSGSSNGTLTDGCRTFPGRKSSKSSIRLVEMIPELGDHLSPSTKQESYAFTAKAKGGRAGESAYFIGVNRNKKSVGLSFQQPDGVKILHELAKTSDVLVENYIP